MVRPHVPIISPLTPQNIMMSSKFFGTYSYTLNLDRNIAYTPNSSGVNNSIWIINLKRDERALTTKISSFLVVKKWTNYSDIFLDKIVCR